MTHTWRLIELDDDDSTVLRSKSLSTNGVAVTQHVPSALADQDGQVVETIEVDFYDYGGSNAQKQAEVAASFLEQAIVRQERKNGPRVFLCIQTTEDTYEYRSEVLGGSVEWDMDALRGYSGGGMEGRITLRRRDFFEGMTLLTAGSGSITNDGDDRLDIATATILGSVPAPIEISIAPTTGGDWATPRVAYAVNAFAQPAATIDLTLAGATLSWASAQTHSELLYSQDLTDSHLENMRGQYFYVVVPFTSAGADIYLRAAVYMHLGASYIPLAYSSEVLVETADDFAVFGPLPFPPSGVGASFGDIALVITGRSLAGITSGSVVAALVQLMPADSFRLLKQRGFTNAIGDTIVDDGIMNQRYTIDATSGNRLPIIEATGERPVLYPKRDNSIHVLLTETGGVDATRAITVTVKYRPRRRTL